MLRQFWKAKGLWLRLLFCWTLGTTFLFFDEVDSFDLRLRLRGPQAHSDRITVVQINQDHWLRDASLSVPEGNRDDIPVTTESYFWDPSLWNDLLTRILEQEPSLIGVTFFFNNQLARPAPEHTSLADPRVIWAAQLDGEGRPALPVMANPYNHNTALIDLRSDKDSVLRRFSPPLSPLPHLAVKLAASSGSGSLQNYNDLFGDFRLINFRGHGDIYPTITAKEVLEGRVPPGFFADKIVLIGTSNVVSHRYNTPVGTMNRAQVMAQILDNVMNRLWIQRHPLIINSLYLLVILLLAMAVLMSYPQSVAFVFLVWIAAGTMAFSLWVFDSFMLWLPAFTPVASLLITYIAFIAYQLSLKENKAWRLEKERQLLSEVEQLRSNFVSLFSHDLKTPIAKIQAICDRLLSTPTSEDIREGLLAVRKESVELHRYIQSILQLSRLESHSVELRKEAIDLNEIVENVVEQIQPLAADKRQDIDIKLEPLFSIEVDGTLMREVILNLVENAVKYTPNDGHIEVKTEEIEDRVIFAVQDNGPGIPAEERQRIFEKFFRSSSAPKQIKGTGLGLYLVKYFVELHGGEVFLESELGRGTRVGFSLPLQG